MGANDGPNGKGKTMRNEVSGVASVAEWTAGGREEAFKLGEKLLIRTVTMYQTGEIIGICDGFLVLGDAAWVANTGPFAKALETGQLEEVEPIHGPVRVNIGAIVDVCIWNHPLPRSSSSGSKKN